ncbi:hypothetical protein LguiA_025510 [Lonicera macranthoides]
MNSKNTMNNSATPQPPPSTITAGQQPSPPVTLTPPDFLSKSATSPLSQLQSLRPHAPPGVPHAPPAMTHAPHAPPSLQGFPPLLQCLTTLPQPSSTVTNLIPSVVQHFSTPNQSSMVEITQILAQQMQQQQQTMWQLLSRLSNNPSSSPHNHSEVSATAAMHAGFSAENRQEHGISATNNHAVALPSLQVIPQHSNNILSQGEWVQLELWLSAKFHYLEEKVHVQPETLNLPVSKAKLNTEHSHSLDAALVRLLQQQKCDAAHSSIDTSVNLDSPILQHSDCLPILPIQHMPDKTTISSSVSHDFQPGKYSISEPSLHTSIAPPFTQQFSALPSGPGGASGSTTVQQAQSSATLQSVNPVTFASLFSPNKSSIQHSHLELPTPYFKGEVPAIKLDEDTYQKALVKCKYNLIGRLILPKGTYPIKCVTLHSKLSMMWNLKKAWTISPLGKGYYCLRFSDAADQHIAWTGGQKHLKPGTIKLSPWVPDFVPEKLKQTNAQVWVRLHSIPWEYWDEPLLLSIGRTIGIPLIVDPASLRREFCMYARILIDVDLQHPLPSRVLVEREGFSFEVNVSFEKLPNFCTHCSIVGHFVGECRALKRVQEESSKVNDLKESRSKQLAKKKQQSVHINTDNTPPVSLNPISTNPQITTMDPQPDFTAQKPNNTPGIMDITSSSYVINKEGPACSHIHPQTGPTHTVALPVEPSFNCHILNEECPTPTFHLSSPLLNYSSQFYSKHNDSQSVESFVPNTEPDQSNPKHKQNSQQHHISTNKFAPLSGKFWGDEEDEPPIQTFVHSADEVMAETDPHQCIQLGEDIDQSVLNQETPENMKNTGYLSSLYSDSSPSLNYNIHSPTDSSYSPHKDSDHLSSSPSIPLLTYTTSKAKNKQAKKIQKEMEEMVKAGVPQASIDWCFRNEPSGGPHSQESNAHAALDTDFSFSFAGNATTVLLSIIMLLSCSTQLSLRTGSSISTVQISELAAPIHCCYSENLHLRAQLGGVKKSPMYKEILRDRNGFVDSRNRNSSVAADHSKPSFLLTAVHSLSSANSNLSASDQLCVHGILGYDSSPQLTSASHYSCCYSGRICRFLCCHSAMSFVHR